MKNISTRASLARQPAQPHGSPLPVNSLSLA
jgi:hypothetical protein